MKVHYTLTCFFFLALQDGNTGLTYAEITTHTGTEGGNITVGCSFSFSGSRKLFCKGDCKTGSILIETTNDRAQSGRYSIEYKEGSFPSTKTLMNVSITQLKKSDSGQYRCSLDRTLLPDSHDEFNIIVTEASTTSKPKTTSSTTTSSSSSSTTTSSSSSSNTTSSSSSSSSSSSTTAATKTPSLSSSSGQFTPSSSSTQTTKPHETGSSAGSVIHTTGKLIYVGLVLVVLVIILSAAVLIFCRRRSRKLKEGPVEAAYDSVREASREYEEIREDRRSGCPPVEVSTVYTRVKFTKPHRAETAQCPQDKPELNSDKVVYTEVDFHKSPATSLHRTPDDSRDNVVYSVPLTNRSKDSSPPLYSTVALH